MNTTAKNSLARAGTCQHPSAPSCRNQLIAPRAPATVDAHRTPKAPPSPNEKMAAKKQLRQAADQGDANAQYHLGLSYANGQGLPRNEIEAVKWFRKAAEKNHPEALLAMGLCYQDGYGVDQDVPEAIRHYEFAISQGNEFAESCLYWLIMNSFRKTPDGAHFLSIPCTSR
jgi:TPR repeat protein